MLLELAEAADIPLEAVSIERDESGLAFLVEIRRG